MNTSNFNRPIKIIHAFPCDPSDDRSSRYEKAKKKLEELNALGFGGIVTNVRHTENYTNEPQEWDALYDVAKICSELGLRLWLYDEKGYPSGGAGGLTIEADPEYEAIGIALITEKISPHEKKRLEIPYGHMKFLSAAVYGSEDGSYSSITNFEPISSIICKDGASFVELENSSDRPALLCAFATKRLYEGTHCVHNVCEARRYIDVTNHMAVKEFINNTYEKYYRAMPEFFNNENVGHKYADIGSVEAIFTDEPSLMGCYINKDLTPPYVRDAYDEENMTLYPIITYGKYFADTFLDMHGYLPYAELIYMFCGRSSSAKKFRVDYYNTLSHLYESAFFDQISIWCQEHNVNFSGHILLEDDIRYHVLFEGNYFSLLRHMHYPGIDMLQSIPEDIYRDFVFTPKLASSIARLYSRDHVMSEVSAHAQGGKVTILQMYASLCLQYAFGVDIFTSYYSEDLANAEIYKKHNDALARIDSIMGGKTHTDTLIYYPIEALRAYHVGSDAQYGVYSDEENACWYSLRSLIHEFTDRMIDYDFVDMELLHSCIIEDGRIKTPSGLEYSSFCLPSVEFTDEMLTLISKMQAAGVAVKVINSDILPAYAGEAFADATALASSLSRYDFAVKEARGSNGIACLCRDTDIGRAYMFVNSRQETSQVSVTLSRLKNPVLYSPLEDIYTYGRFIISADTTSAEFEIAPYSTVIIMEKIS